MNVLYHFRVRGVGAERVHIAGISKALRSMGHTVSFVSASGVDPTAPEAERIQVKGAKSAAVRCLHFVADHLPQAMFELIEILYNLYAIVRLRQAILKLKPDVIYERYAFFNFSGAVVASLMNIPLIIEVNELAGYKRVRGQVFIGFAKMIERFVFNRADLITAVSDFLTVCIHRITDGNARTLTIPNGVDPEWAQAPKTKAVKMLRQRLKISDAKVVCFVGGLVPWHNFDLLLRAIRSLREKISNIKLLIIGDGPLRFEIEFKAKAYGIENAIILTGQIPHAKVKLYIAACDVAVIPETNEYRSPIKLFEYMSMAKPVVAPQKPAIEAVIKEGVDGYFFKPGRTESLCRTLNAVISNQNHSDEVGSAARSKILTSYLWQHHARKILDNIQIELL